MKTITLKILPALVLLMFGLAGCNTTSVSGPTHVESRGASASFPRSGDAGQAFDYALYLWDNREFNEAAEFFQRAASVRTETGLWEFEALLNATVCWMEAGDVEKARDALRRAQRIPVDAPPSPRERYLSALLLDGDASKLPPNLRASLPRRR